MSTVGIMQPYVFPYIGYMNLVHASDKFVFYDDVNFIKKGQINRNNIILIDRPYRFTISLREQSQNKLIKDIEILNLKAFSEKFLKQLDASYKNSLYKNATLGYVQNVLTSGSKSISDLAILSVKNFFKYIGIEKKFLVSSKEFSSTQKFEKTDRLIAITKKLGCKNYANAVGGLSLYIKEDFKRKGINLKFVKPVIKPYIHTNLKSNNFYPGLSIIDVMMNLSIDEICSQLESYLLV